MRRLKFGCAVLLGTALSTGLVAGGAQAQDAAADTGANDIVVTAQRQSQRLQDVPLSVQAVSGDTLRDRGITDQRQLGLIAPSLQVQRDNNYSIRGIGTQSFANTIESSVATAIDDVTLGNRFLNGNPFMDVERIEVLNGPQGLLFGKNASAGLVNITTTRPVIGELGASFDMQATSNQLPGDDALGAQTQATINMPVTANSALRISGIYKYQEPMVHFERRDGTGRNDTNYRQYGLRGKYLLQASDRLSLYLIGEYFEARGIGTLFDSSYRMLATDSVNTGPLALDGVTPGPRNFTLVTDAPQYRDLDTGGAQGTVDYEFDNGMVLSNTFAWKYFSLNQNIDADSTGSNGANVNWTDSRYDQYSNELRLALPSTGRLTGQFGLYYFHSKLDQQSQIAGNNFFPDFLLPSYPFCVGASVSAPCSQANSYFLGTDKLYTMKNTSYAGFGQLNYELSDQFSLFAGGRVTRDRVSIDLTQNVGNYFVVLGVPDTAFNQSYKHTNFSWKAGGQFKPSRDVMLYANYGRGYKGPGMNDTGASADANLIIYPETTDTVEVGVKSSFLDRKVTLNLSAFHTLFNNFQIQSFDPDLRTFVIGNAAKVKSKGVEASLEVRPARGLTLSATGAYTDTKFDRYEAAQCYPGQNEDCSTFDASGYRLAYAPKFTGTIGAAYEQPLGSSDTRLMVDANLYHRSRVETLNNHAPGSQIGAINILNASLGLRGDVWNASIFCKNCTNKVYPLAIEVESGDSSASPAMLSYTQRWGLDSTRSIGLRFGYNF